MLPFRDVPKSIKETQRNRFRNQRVALLLMCRFNVDSVDIDFFMTNDTRFNTPPVQVWIKRDAESTGAYWSESPDQ